MGSSREDLLRRRVAVVSGTVAALAFAAVVTASFVIRSDPYPDEWDPRAVDLVAFVERERGLEFDHPVHIDFLTPAEYSEATRTDDGALTDEERRSFEETAGLLRSLGLVSGDVDLLSSVNDLADSGTLAYYDHVTKRITVRGTAMTVDLEVTLVHELVHALQDQHAGLERLMETGSSGAATAFRAVVEGDATLVEEIYVEMLDDADRDAYLSTTEAQYETAGIDQVPGILSATFGAPYALGAPLVGIVQSEGGWRAVDDLLRDPPSTELELLDPYAYLGGFSPVDVPAPSLPPAHDDVDEGDFGAVGLYLMLATRMDALKALEVADGWGGDAYLTSTDQQDRLCTTIATTGRDDAATAALDAALRAWAAVAPEGSDATVERDGGIVTLRSCDPGGSATATHLTDPLVAIALPSTRSYLVYAAVQSGLPVEAGQCVAEEVLGATSVDLLGDPDPDEAELDALISRVGEAMVTCG